MGLWVLKQCMTLSEQQSKFMIKALEDEIRRNELECSSMRKKMEKVRELVVSKKAA